MQASGASRPVAATSPVPSRGRVVLPVLATPKKQNNTPQDKANDPQTPTSSSSALTTRAPPPLALSYHQAPAGAPPYLLVIHRLFILTQHPNWDGCRLVTASAIESLYQSQ